MDYKKNIIKLDLASYRHYWRGQSKVGKTSLFRDLVIEAYGNAEFGLLLSLGQEVGYKALDNLYAHDCPTWSEFVEIVDDLVENKSENKFKILALDTVDELVSIAEKEVLRLHRVSKGESATSINSALGGYGAGKKKSRSLVEEQIARLERSGYGMIYISHTKIKDITEKATEQAYQQLTGALEFSYDAIFSDRADVMAMFVTESQTQDDRLKSTKRFIYFRSTNFIDAGSRMANLPEKIELGAKEYISAINFALEKTSGVSGKDAEKLRKAEQKELAEKAVEFSKADKVEKLGDETLSLEDYLAELVVMAKGLSAEDKEIKQAELKEKKLPSSPKAFKEITDMALAVEVHKVLAG